MGLRRFAFGDGGHQALRPSDKFARFDVVPTSLVDDVGFHEIIGRGPALRKVLQIVERVAAGDSTVLLLGETGTGKELIARALHNRSNRRSRSFVKLNCAAIPSGLLESELFG